MKTQEERKERRRAALTEFREAVKDRVNHALRPFDADDKEAAQALAASLLVAMQDGISAQEEAALVKLFEAFKEARANTP